MAKTKRKICVVGLGYVGLPLSVAFGKRDGVSGYDVSGERVAELKGGHDRNGEVPAAELRRSKISFSADPAVIRQSDFIIVAIPTPVDKANRPDLTMLRDATKTIGRNLSKGSTVVFESTVYPGTTEEEMRPILEKESGLKCGRDFNIGYSPERINPGDREHTVEKIVKVVAGDSPETTDTIADVYGSIVKAGIHKAPSIKVAEAAKAIENIQRDINIALMNELKVIFDRMGIDTEDVLEAARTKWNFLNFRPGLVGGHCICVDPYYLAYKAEAVGHHPEMILAGRRINDSMPKYVVSSIVSRMKEKGLRVKGSRVLVLGATFKPNVKDMRNSKVKDVVDGLRREGCTVDIHDPVIDEKAVFGLRNISSDEAEKNSYDYVVLAVKHEKLKGLWGRADFVV